MANVDIGSYLNGAMGIASVGMNDIMDVYNSAQSQLDKSKYDVDPRRLNSYSDLVNYTPQFGDYSDLHKPNFIESFVDYNVRTGKGALAGLSFGPWGALAGAIAGSAMSLANTFTKLGTYNKDFNEMSHMNNTMMHTYDTNVKDTVNNVKNNDMYRSNYLSSKRIYAEGGDLDSFRVNNGGMHETNPYGGVPMGMGSNGRQNFVEEGEVIWKDYVFPKRQRPNREILKKFNTNFNKEFESYADVAQYILDMHKEHENNAYDQQTLDREMNRLRQAKEYQDIAEIASKYGMTPEQYISAVQQQQEEQMALQQQAQQEAMAQQQIDQQTMMEQPFYQGAVNPVGFACGGKLKGNMMAYGGDTKRNLVVPVTTSLDTLFSRYSDKNLDAGNRADSWNNFYNNYIVPNTGKDFTVQSPKEYFKDEWKSGKGDGYFGKLSGAKGSRFDTEVTQRLTDDMLEELSLSHNFPKETIIKKLGDEYFGPIKNHAYYLSRLNSEIGQSDNIKSTPERIKVSPEGLSETKSKFPIWGNEYDDEPNSSNNKDWWKGVNPMRLAPIFNNLRNVLEQNKPDYTYSNQLKSLYQPIETQPIGRPVSYTPIDQYSLLNRANQANNTMLGIYRNNATTPVANGYFALNANQAYQQSLANNLIQGLNYNDSKHLATTQFNNSLAQWNEQNRLNIESANRALRTQLYGQAYAAVEQERLAVEQAREANLQNLADNMGMLGKEWEDYKHVSDNKALMYGPWANWYKDQNMSAFGGNLFDKGGLMYPGLTRIKRYEELAEQLNPEYEGFKSFRSWKKEQPKEERSRLNYNWDRYQNASEALKNSWVNRKYMNEAYSQQLLDDYANENRLEGAVDKGFLEGVTIQPENDRTRRGLRKRIDSSTNWYLGKLWEYQNEVSPESRQGEIKQLASEKARQMEEERKIQEAREFRHSAEGANAAFLGAIGLATAPFTTVPGLIEGAVSGVAGTFLANKLADQATAHWRKPDSRYTNENPTYDEWVEQQRMNDILDGKGNSIKYDLMKYAPDVAGFAIGAGIPGAKAAAGRGIRGVRNLIRSNRGKDLLPERGRFIDRRVDAYQKLIDARRLRENPSEQIRLMENVNDNGKFSIVDGNTMRTPRSVNEVIPDYDLATPNKKLEYEQQFNRGIDYSLGINKNAGIKTMDNNLYGLNEDGQVVPIDKQSANSLYNTAHWITDRNGKIHEITPKEATIVNESGRKYVKANNKKIRVSDEDANQILAKQKIDDVVVDKNTTNNNTTNPPAEVSEKKSGIGRKIAKIAGIGAVGSGLITAASLGSQELNHTKEERFVDRLMEGDAQATREYQKMTDQEQFNVNMDMFNMVTNDDTNDSMLSQMFSDDTPDALKDLMKELTDIVDLKAIDYKSFIDNPAYSDHSSSKFDKIPTEWADLMYSWYMGKTYKGKQLSEFEPYKYMQQTTDGDYIRFQKELLIQYLSAHNITIDSDDSFETLFNKALSVGKKPENTSTKKSDNKSTNEKAKMQHEQTKKETTKQLTGTIGKSKSSLQKQVEQMDLSLFD